MYRGSQRHVLDLLNSGQVVERLNGIFYGLGISLCNADKFRPVSHDETKEWTIRRFCREHFDGWAGYAEFDKWWVPDKYRNPQWDMLSTCMINGKRGLLMVEAKARVCLWKAAPEF